MSDSAGCLDGKSKPEGNGGLVPRPVSIGRASSGVRPELRAWGGKWLHFAADVGSTRRRSKRCEFRLPFLRPAMTHCVLTEENAIVHKHERLPSGQFVPQPVVRIDPSTGEKIRTSQPSG